ncbi:MAG: CapA family protein [Gammaproteobacteria bacterium]
MTTENLNVFVCGDVMTGRGIDQILRHPCDPRIYESYLKDARDYVELAEHIHGKIPRGVAGSYVWEKIAPEWQKRRPLVKIINLETAVTVSDKHWAGKGINYRMHPQNIDVLTSAQIDICALANNHVLDWEVEGLRETLGTLEAAGIKYAGAGENRAEAMKPVVHKLPGDKRLLLFSLGTASSGIPGEWSAAADRAGVYLLEDLASGTIRQIKENVEQYRQTGDLIIISIHWGSNWGYEIPVAHQLFAHNLIDEVNADLIHGHSSHHPIAIEIYRDKPVLYGCGDFINDYEGIHGREALRGDLSVMYFLEFDPRSLHLRKIELVPLQVRLFQLNYASLEDRQWLVETFSRISATWQTPFRLDNDHTISVNMH